jgi:hypothetical protein
LSIKVSERRAVFAELKPYCFHAGENDFIEVIEWSNGEGFDIVIDRKNNTERFSITHGEWECLQVLLNWKGE